MSSDIQEIPRKVHRYSNNSPNGPQIFKKFPERSTDIQEIPRKVYRYSNNSPKGPQIFKKFPERSTDIQEIPRNNPPLDPVRSQINPVYNPPSILFLEDQP